MIDNKQADGTKEDRDPEDALIWMLGTSFSQGDSFFAALEKMHELGFRLDDETCRELEAKWTAWELYGGPDD